MKILWLHEILGAQGGAEANVLSTARALRLRGHGHALAYQRLSPLGADGWSEAFDLMRPATTPDDVLNLCAEWKPDVVWIHNWTQSALFPLLRECGLPAARMVHDHSLYCLRQYKYHPLTRRNCQRPASLACLFPCLAFLQRGAGKWPIRWASLGAKLREIADNRTLPRMVVASRAMREELLRNGFAAEAIRIVPPVPPPSGTEAAGPPSWSEGQPGELLYCGQILRGKGVDYLLRAVAQLTVPWHLTVAGEGSALPKCRALAARLGLGERVRFVGHLAPEALDAAYRRAAVVVVPSAWAEPFGMVGLEAMRRARPVVGFAVGGIPDWLEHGQNGLLVPPAQPAALAVALTELLTQPERAEACGLRGWEMARTKFSFVRALDDLEEIFTHLVSSSTALPHGQASAS